ncbi:MAG: hypothetical protein JEZ09_05295 [Salinivirgaceae bacterium]|nr:hypothetical protein [Salinivirgaceae bacterium]
MNKLLKFFGKIIIVFVLLSGILVLISFIIEDKITQRAVEELNETINVPVLVDEINLSLLRNFPKATLELKNVTILSAKQLSTSHFSGDSGDTLLHAKRIFLSFNILPLLKSKYVLDKISLEKATLNILIDKNGKDNYSILNAMKPSTKNENTNIDVRINQFQFKQVQFNYINKYKESEFGFFTNKYVVSGAFYKSNFSIATKGKLDINYVKQANIVFQPKSKTSADLDLQYRNDSLLINSGTISSSIINFQLAGSILFNKVPSVDLKFSGDNIQISELLNLMNLEGAKDLEGDGELKVSGYVKGKLTKKIIPKIETKFEIENATIKNPSKNIEVKNVFIGGYYSNGAQRNQESSVVELHNIKFNLNDGFVSGSFSIKNFSSPYISIQTNCDVNLKELFNLLNDATTVQIGGRLKGEFVGVGYLNFTDSIKNTDFSRLTYSGKFNLSEGFYNSENLSIKDLQTDVVLNNTILTVNKFQGLINTSKTSGTGSISNLLPFIQSKSQLIINADVFADNINYKNFEMLFNDEKESEENVDYKVHLSFRILDFTKGKINAKRVSGIFNYLNKNISVDDLQFNAFGGKVLSSVTYNSKSTDKTEFNTHTILTNIDVKDLFETFDNFNQKSITSSHIAGRLTSDFQLQFMVQNSKVLNSSIDYLGHIRISDGQLNNFKPIMEASKYSEVNELENIKFSELNNDLLISDETIYIPEMTIESSAFDISLNGQQKFNGDYEYHLKIYLSDFLKGKAEHIHKQQSEFGKVEDDGFGRKPMLFLVTSTNGKSEVKLDKSRIKKNLKSNFNAEKNEFKAVLKKEFGWFKKDSTLNKPKEKKPEFEIEWDDD